VSARRAAFIANQRAQLAKFSSPPSPLSTTLTNLRVSRATWYVDSAEASAYGSQ
jgi:hypothetical protein